MTGTNERRAIAVDAKGIGAMRITEQPVTLGIAGREDPPRTTDLQAAALLATGGRYRWYAARPTPLRRILSGSPSRPNLSTGTQ